MPSIRTPEQDERGLLPLRARVVGSASFIAGRRNPPTDRAAVKLVHTFAWLSIEACLVYVLRAGIRRRSDRRVAIAAAVVGSGSLAFAANGFRFPLTQVAERIDAERGSVADINLPRWFADTLPAIRVPLILLVGCPRERNLRRQ